ncbi:hypothetical protein ElyMa_000299000 [Elysia marginata]|uniref:Uncharacterized protein n=1 Tax=Elysia marginata TaxID=1093978 RepID=A0AAV4F8P5_9GAST|nr:hypothetical protein ElyMa_000299000 [Elysia marginata]
MAEKRDERVLRKKRLLPASSEPSSGSSSSPPCESQHGINTSLSPVSHQLMYPEKFTDCYKEEKLKIIGKERCTSSQTFHVPQNPVLSRIRNFLPQLSQANKNMAVDIASNPDQNETLTIEPFSMETDESDDDDDDDGGEEKDKGENDLTKKKVSKKDQNSATFVEMNVALVPPEVLSKFDDDDTSSSDESTGDADVDETAAAPTSQTTPSPLISLVDESNSSDIALVKDGSPHR